MKWSDLQAINKIARVVSDILIPPVFTLLGFLYIALILDLSFTDSFITISSAIIFGVILPLAVFSVFRKKKLITENDAVLKEERYSVFLLFIVINFCGAIYILALNGNLFSSQVWFIITINSICLTIINYFWKISLHAMAAATFLGLLYFLGSVLFVYCLLLAITVGISRYILKVHTPAQIIAGIVFGFFATLLQLHLFSGMS